MSEPADEEVVVPQPSTEAVEEEEAKQVVDGEATEENQPEREEIEVQQQRTEEVEVQQEKEEIEVQPEREEIEVQQEEEEKEDSAAEDPKWKLQLETEESEGQSQEEQEQQQSQDGVEEPQKPLDDSQDTVQMPITDTLERALEDEEMPSMVTISSTSRIDESEIYNSKQDDEAYDKQDEESNFVEKYSPQPVVRQQEKDSDSDSVCVIDDDDDDEDQNDYDEEEDDRNNRKRVRHNDDDGESSYDDEYDGSSSYDSEDVDDEEQYNEKYDRRYQRNDRRGIEEEVEDDDDDDEDGEHEDEYMDDQDFGGGGSDDAVLRPNSNGLAKQQKERSSSLQDLSLIQGSAPKNRHNVNPFSQKAIFERNQVKANPYGHVQSKVKQYIDDGTEQRRIANEKRKKSVDETRHRNEEPTDIQIQRSEEVAMACQTMKNYAEKTLKEVAECEENDKMIFLQQGMENGEISLIPRQLMSSHSVEMASKANEMEIDLVDDDDEKRPPTFNGTVPKENQNNYATERKGIMRRDDGPPKSSLFNGEDPLSFQQPLDNLRTLSYDEYMKGAPIGAALSSEVVVSRIDVSEVQSAEIEDDSGLRIESVVSNYSSEKVVEDFQSRRTPPTMVHQSTETFYQENPELHSLRAQLNQRNQQFESLRDAYQKNMSDSLAMRMELENLRKAVAYYQEQQQRSPRVETKVSAVQTEVRDMPLIDLEGGGSSDPKLGVSQVSTQWSDSTGSAAAISMDPPNVTNALNSDESGQPKTPKMPKRNALSRAFMTSTKILQTLSSITHGKTKVDKKPAAKVKESSTSRPGPASSKKRKASDALDDSAQPTKIPKSNDREDVAPGTADSVFVNPNSAAEPEKKTTAEEEEEASPDDEVKVYMYPDDDEGHDHSFLIQAKEVSSNPKPGVRECGPYLLGNVEVYMTEVNGTINIWGKELSQTSQSQTTTEPDLDASARSRDLRQNLRWQSTPRIFNKHEPGVSASTSKKSRLLPRYLQPERQEPHQCEHHHNRLSWPSCHDHQQHHHHHQQQQHSCCKTPPMAAASCGCVHEQQRTPVGGGCCMSKSMPNVNQNCCYGAQKPLARRHSFNPTDDEDSDQEEEDPNRTLQADDCSPRSFGKSKTAQQPRRSTGSSSDPTMLCENESDPLIAARQVLDGMEGPDKSKKKKVRGLLMDLLRKGCAGDCRTNPLDKSNMHHTTSIYEPSTSAQHRLPSQPSHSHRSNERCTSCCKQPDKTSQIEAQMERFRDEMEKLRSQSDTLAGMIQALKNADIIN